MVNELLKILECGNSLGPKFLQFHADWDAFTASDRDAFIALGNTRCRSRGSHGVARKSIAEDHGSRKVSAAFRPFSVSESHETSLRFRQHAADDFIGTAWPRDKLKRRPIWLKTADLR